MSCDLVIVCVSDDYALSKNCLRELNFAVNSMKLPIVTLVVGEGFNWQKSKVGLMLGDQVYLDATKADNISSRMESLVSALDRSISNNNLQDRLSISEEPDTIPDASLYTQLDESFSPDNLLQDLREIDETFANLPQLNLVVGEKVEVLRWRFTRKSYHVGGGLHWVPVQIVEIGAPTNPYDPTSSRLIKVLFQARISYNKTKNGPLVMNVVDEDVEWIEEFLIRKPSEMPRNLPDLDIGDAVEFRQFVHRDKAKRSKEAYLANNGVGSDLGDLEEEEQDTYMFWPAFIVAKMANRKYLIRQSKGMGIMAEDGNYASALKLVSAKLLRIGHHPKMLRVRHALNQKYLIVLPKGSIVRPQYVPDIKEDQEPHLLLTGNKLMDQIGVIMLTPEPEEEYRGSKGHKTTRASIAKEQKSSKLPIPDPNLSLRDNFLRSSFILWKHATAGGFKVDPQKYAVLWLSHAFRTPRVEDTEGRLEMTPGYLAQVLAKRSVHVIDSGVEVGDFSELDEDEIKVKLFKGIVKASVFLALLTPEYLASDLHQKEIEYAKALHIPILYALVHNDKSKNPASVFANNALSYFKLLNSDSIIDFTVRPLIWSRIDTLVYRMNHQLKVINANRKQSRLKTRT
ncbi:hypothetical protein BCR33DRAFT_337838 [Rhizoclosmatium globosum]|uniref:TIR domain-containing protein n=1 Tax=Rhizoclosmatium globosum TaxID=329046 RepID=A0A1Y2C5W5_9FUNG|nr:hypothetical protein BCR33DRAFT_337838 [Rhizoclosmatium globosum]|eukprot:ORY41685.1 hypothetical protein BCR33DRAFT_337838 [Rhizoclosmatium globosum]